MRFDVQQLLCDLLAVSEGGLQLSALMDALDASGAGEDEEISFSTIVKLLAKLPVLRTDRGFVLEEPEPHFREVWKQGRYLYTFSILESVQPYRRAWGNDLYNVGPFNRTLRFSLLTGDDALLRELRGDRPELYPYFRRWFFGPMHRGMLDALTDLGAGLCCEAEIDGCFEELRGLGELATYLESADPAKHLLVRARLYLLDGELERASAVLASLPDEVGRPARALLALWSGDIRVASSIYSAELAQRRKATTNDYVPTAPEALFLPVAFVLHGTKTKSKQAVTMAARAHKYGWDHPDHPLAGWKHVRLLVDPTTKVSRARHPAAILLEQLVKRWRGDAVDRPRAKAAADQLRECGFVLFADALEADDGGPVARLREVRPAWRDTLAALERTLDSASKNKDKGKNEGPSERLAWFVDLTVNRQPELNCHLQKRTKSGWSHGRKVATKRLVGAADVRLPWTAADRVVASALKSRTYRTWSGYSETELTWEPTKTWKALVGHPHVFDAEGEALRVLRRAPQLRLRKTDAGRRMELHPPLKKGEVAIERVGDAYEVTMLEPEQQATAALVARGLDFPAEAGAELQAWMKRAASLFGAPESTATVRRGAAEVHLFLSPSGSTVSVELGVLPAGGEGPRLVPGRGPGVVHGPESEGNVRVARDLAVERANLSVALSLPGLEEADDDGVTVLELETVLDLIATARDLEIPVHWPKGGELRIRRATGTSGLKIRSNRDWFEALGSLELDDGERVGLQELARQFLNARQRFVRLDDGTYIALEASLRRSLDALVRLGTPMGEAIRVHPLATSVLASVLDLDGTTATPKAKARLRELQVDTVAVEVPRGLKAELRPYQHDAFEWLAGLARVGAGAILADDMGLGKTITSLALLLTRRGEGPALVVAPTSVAGNWVRETARFAPGMKVHRLREIDGDIVENLGPNELLICSYGLLVHRVELLAGRSWSTVVFDESQALKNPKTLRHQAALRIQASFRIALTGTPIENHLGELHAQMSVVLPGLLGAAQRFNERFARPVEAGDREARRSLKSLVAPFLLRRTKAAVLSDLPARIELQHPIELSVDEKRVYEAERLRALEDLEQGSGAIEVLAQLSRLRQLACSPALVVPGYTGESSKTRAFRYLARDLHAGGHRALVFSQFTRHLALLRAVLDDEGLEYAYLDGSTPAARRDSLVTEFQNGDTPFFLISLKAGGTGLNLTAADYVLHMDPWWNPAVEDQASDRAHRIGQQRPVTIYRVIAKGTIEEQIVALHHEKRDLASQILEGRETVKRLSTQDLMALLQGI